MLEVQFVHVVLGFQGKDLVLGLFGESGAGLGEVVELLDALDGLANLLVVATVDLVLDGLLLASSVDLLLHELVAGLDIVVVAKTLVERVLLELDLVAVTLDHNLLDLVLLDVLVNSVVLSRIQGRQCFEAVRAGLQVVAVEGDAELLTDCGVINLVHTKGFFFLELLLGSLNLAGENHQASNYDRYRLDLLMIERLTYFFSCSNFLVKLSASRWRR